MAIHSSGVECELREVLLKNKPIEMLQASPKGTVPVLVDGDRVIDQSIDIMAWALNQADPEGWLSHGLDHAVIHTNDGAFKTDLDRYKYHDRFPGQPQSWYFEKALGFASQLESMLVAGDDGRCFLASSKISILDIAIFPFIRQFAFVDKANFDAQQLPKLQAWLAFMLESHCFLTMMEKVPVWQSGQPQCTLIGT